jgi:hypothetical protein
MRMQLHVYLRREGWKVNRKRVYRLYAEEGLSLGVLALTSELQLISSLEGSKGPLRMSE